MLFNSSQSIAEQIGNIPLVQVIAGIDLFAIFANIISDGNGPQDFRACADQNIAAKGRMVMTSHLTDHACQEVALMFIQPVGNPIYTRI